MVHLRCGMVAFLVCFLLVSKIPFVLLESPKHSPLTVDQLWNILTTDEKVDWEKVLPPEFTHISHVDSLNLLSDLVLFKYKTSINSFMDDHDYGHPTQAIPNLNIVASEPKIKAFSSNIEALNSFYTKTRGWNWFDNTYWTDTNTCYCEWYGISCSPSCSPSDCQNDACKVTSISLLRNNLEGEFHTFQEELQHMTLLQTLRLSDNRISGTLPQLNMPSLEVLELSNNEITGTIPNFQYLQRLQVLSLAFNALTESIPSFQNLSSILSINLSNNQLNGTISRIINPTLSKLTASRNMLKGELHDFMDCYSLYTLNLNSNQISSNVSNLRFATVGYEIELRDNYFFGNFPLAYEYALSIDMADNQISGGLPSNFTSPLLNRIDMSYNFIEGEIKSLEGLVSATYINFDDNLLLGRWPRISQENTILYLILSRNRLNFELFDFQRLPNALVLSLHSNRIYGSVPNFTGLPRLIILSLFSNRLTGQLPDFANLYSINILYLHLNSLSGRVPDFRCMTLTRLYLFSNLLEGECPSFRQLPRLEVLSLFNNRMSGSLPLFQDNNVLVEVSLFINDFIGTIPNYKNLQRLEILALNANYLVGPIPEFTNIPFLKELWVTFNDLEGTVPSFSQYPRLELLSFADVNIAGALPDFQLPALHSLYASTNKLAGTIPLFAGCPLLNTLVLFRNNFTGPYPGLSLAYLTDLDLSSNSLSGDLISFSGTPALHTLQLSRNQFTGAIPDLSVMPMLKELALDRNAFNLVPSNMFSDSPLLEIIDLSSNRLSYDIHSMIYLFTMTKANVPYSAQAINFRNNSIYGRMDGIIYNFFGKAQRINFANNMLTILDDISAPNMWQDVDLSGNPFEGQIPESIDQLQKLSTLDLSGTKMRSRATLLPSSFFPSQEYKLANLSESFVCPVIEGNGGLATITLDPIYYSHEFCLCLPDTYGTKANCEECTTDCKCPGGSVIQDCFPVQGSDESYELIPCPNKDACNPDAKSSFVCKEGYEDRLCSRCSQGYSRSERACVKCTQSSRILFTLFAPIFVIFLMIFIAKMASNESGLLRILVLHMQMISMLVTSTFNAEESEAYSLYIVARLSTLEVLSQGCLYEEGQVFVPYAVSYARLLLMILALLFSYYFLRYSRFSRVLHIVLFLFQFMYTGISERVFRAFACVLHQDSNDTWYLNEYPWISCSPMEEEYKSILMLSVIVFFVYTIGYPVFGFYYIYKQEQIRTKTPLDYYTGMIYTSFCGVYKEKVYYWEFVILARRLLLAAVINMIPYTRPELATVSIFFILQMSVLAHHFVYPYNRKIENHLELCSLYVLTFSFLIGFVVSNSGSNIFLELCLVVSNLATLFVLFASVANHNAKRISFIFKEGCELISSGVSEVWTRSRFSRFNIAPRDSRYYFSIST